MTVNRSTLDAMSHVPPTDAALACVAAARLSRIVTTDTIGEIVRGPSQRWAAGHEHAESPPGWRTHLVGGLQCPFCVGFWLGLGVIGSYAVVRDKPKALAAWRFLAAGLSMNYVVGHVSSRLD